MLQLKLLSLEQIKFTHKVNSLLQVLKSRLRVTQNLMTGLTV